MWQPESRLILNYSIVFSFIFLSLNEGKRSNLESQFVPFTVVGENEDVSTVDLHYKMIAFGII